MKKKSFGVQNSNLTTSLTAVGITYSQKALKKGDTYIDYNIPAHRCAYIYRFATCHTGFVHKYFRKLMRKRSSKVSLTLKNATSKSSLKICCLGGGPGIDVVGIIKVLALYPTFDKAITSITVLDICGGWRNTFKRIIQKINDGKLKGVSETFLDSNVNAQLIQVDLIENLPTSILQIIQEADIICMVKFVSAVIGKPSAESALQHIMSNTKKGAVVLFIDNLSGNVFQSMNRVTCNSGLQNVLGPENTLFVMRGTFQKNLKELYGCFPLQGSKLTIAGWINDVSISVPHIGIKAQSGFYPESIQTVIHEMPKISDTAQNSEIYENAPNSHFEADEDLDLENDYSSDDFSTSLDDQESAVEFDFELLAKQIAERIYEQTVIGVSGESFKTMIDRVVYEHLKDPKLQKRYEVDNNEDKVAQYNLQSCEECVIPHNAENKYEPVFNSLPSNSLKGANQPKNDLTTHQNEGSECLAKKNDFTKRFCDKATQTDVEENCASLLSRLDNLIVSFENIRKRLSSPSCCHNNYNSCCHNNQAATTALQSPLLVLPLHNLKDSNLSQICTFMSSNFSSSNSS